MINEASVHPLTEQGDSVSSGNSSKRLLYGDVVFQLPRERKDVLDVLVIPLDSLLRLMEKTPNAVLGGVIDGSG